MNENKTEKKETKNQRKKRKIIVERNQEGYIEKIILREKK